MPELVEELGIHDEDGALRAEYVRAVADTLQNDDARQLRKLIKELHVADIADLIEFLPSDERVRFIELQGRTCCLNSMSPSVTNS